MPPNPALNLAAFSRCTLRATTTYRWSLLH